MPVSVRDGKEVTVWSADHVTGCAAVQGTESPALGDRSLGSSPSSGAVPVVFSNALVFTGLQP